MTKLSDIDFNNMPYDEYWSGSWMDEVDEEEDGTPIKRTVPPPTSPEGGVIALMRIAAKDNAAVGVMYANGKWMFATSNATDGWEYESDFYPTLRHLLHAEISKRTGE